MVSPDLESLEAAISARLLAIENDLVTPAEPLILSTFNLLDEAFSNDNTPHKMPAVGILHVDEAWERNQLLGSGNVSQPGREHWKLIYYRAAPKRGEGFRGVRGLYHGSKAIIEELDGWHITDGCPIQIDRRQIYRYIEENGEVLPIAGMTIDLSHPCYIES